MFMFAILLFLIKDVSLAYCNSNDVLGSNTSINSCKISFYTEANYVGSVERIYENTGNFNIREQSIKTVGQCCWRIYR